MRIPRPTGPGASPLTRVNDNRNEQTHTAITLGRAKGDR
jgi:hypothetical protein